jgi:hypothetical protein
MSPEELPPSPAEGSADGSAEGSAGGSPEPELAPHRVEPARSSRARCRSCKRKIEKGELRLGVLLEGPYGTGYLWHHLRCAAKRRFEDVEAAYEERAWDQGLEVPSLDELGKLREEAQRAKEAKRELPYAERSPSGRAKCKQCGELIDKDAWRVALGKLVEFGNQTRTTPIHVHTACVTAALREPDCAFEPEGIDERIRLNSRGLEADEVDLVLREVEAAG